MATRKGSITRVAPILFLLNSTGYNHTGLGFAAFCMSGEAGAGEGAFRGCPRPLLLSLLELAGWDGRDCPVPKWKGVAENQQHSNSPLCTHRHQGLPCARH